MPSVDPHRTFTQAPNLFSKFASPHCPHRFIFARKLTESLCGFPAHPIRRIADCYSPRVCLSPFLSLLLGLWSGPNQWLGFQRKIVLSSQSSRSEVCDRCRRREWVV